MGRVTREDFDATGAEDSYTEGIIEGLPTATVAFVAPPTANTFYVEVTSADGTGSSDHYYVLQRR